MITLKWECPEFHKEYTASRTIVHEIADEATREEMLDAYVDFLKGMGYNVPEFSHLEFVDEKGAPAEHNIYLVKNDN